MKTISKEDLLVCFQNQKKDKAVPQLSCYIVFDWQLSHCHHFLAATAGNTGASTASTGLSTGEIAAIILAVLLLLILIIIIIICCLTHGK